MVKKPTKKRKLTPSQAKKRVQTRVKRQQTKASRLASHKKRCSICKSDYCARVNDLYKNLHPAGLIAKMLDGMFTEQSIKRHVRALGLLKKRNQSVLLKVRAILAAYEPGKSVPSDGLVAKALELEAKITKELSDDKNDKLTVELGAATRKLAEKLHQNLLDRLNGGSDENV